MFLLLFLLGLIIGANREAIYKQTTEDTRKAYQKLSATQLAATSYYVVETLFGILERKFSGKDLSKDCNIINPCRKLNCDMCGGRALNIKTYIRKIKAYN